MDKKITTLEELLKKYEECKVLVDIRQKWTSEDIKNMICIKIGINLETENGLENSEKIIEKIVQYLEKKKVENIALLRKEFKGYSGENPSVEIVIPGKGQVVFGNVSENEIIEILERYLFKNDEIIKFLEKNR